MLQPDMRLTAEAAGNAWVELNAGEGGVDGYPTSVSDFYQDMTGRGCFAGKGIYDVRAFAEATEGVLGDDILSHDLIEGILSGAGLVSDVRFYDGCPQELGAELTRLHRWTRGDWQLLPLLFSKLRLGAAERMKLAGNLLRSLYAPALLVLIVLSVWTNAPGALALGLAVNFLEPLLNLFLNRNRKGGRCWKAALLRLATLPATAACQADAIARTLWRLAVSHRHLMEWVPAADAAGGGTRARRAGRIAALLTLPGLAWGGWTVPVLALGLLFWVGADWAGDLSRQRTGARAPLGSGETELLRELARRTWRFFEAFVPEDGNGLPPDNVQLDPPVGAAERTSPTNVGMYLLSCLAARELGFIDGEALRRRLAGTVDTLERLQKWRGQLYNWYDTRTLEPLRPRYVSAVDSGNLAAALLLCAQSASNNADRGEGAAPSSTRTMDAAQRTAAPSGMPSGPQGSARAEERNVESRSLSKRAGSSGNEAASTSARDIRGAEECDCALTKAKKSDEGDNSPASRIGSRGVKRDSTSADVRGSEDGGDPASARAVRRDGDGGEDERSSWAELARRLRSLAEGMELAALYDGERELFRIGMDVENGRLSESHYDLYASEARILSFAAMMLGQVPAKHWSRLNRVCVRAGKGQALLSWSGTMFEYLMPELLLRSPANSLAGRSREAVAACQIRRGRRLERPWGVSESGYYAFDARLNYQYRAFGLPELALSGEAEADVVAPYAAALALCCEPRAAAENLRKMCALGWVDEYGLYEAADYTRARAAQRGRSAPKVEPCASTPWHGPSVADAESEREMLSAPSRPEARLVRSHMAHHQGMALCAICNALRDDALSKRFLGIPEARALRLLLQERPGERPAKRARRHPSLDTKESPEPGFARGGRAEGRLADVHLLYGARTTTLVTARGATFAWSGDVLLNRFTGDLTDPHQGMYLHLEDANTGERTVIGRSGRVSFDAGVARFRERFAGLNVEMKLAVSPEEGALYCGVEVENPGDEARELRVTLCLAVALAPWRDMRAHPVFQNLFVEGERVSPRILALRRRPRTPSEALPELLCLVRGGEQPRAELRLDKLVGRTGSLGQPGGLAPGAWMEVREDAARASKGAFAAAEAVSGEESDMARRREALALLDPCAALEVRVRAEAGGSRRLHFALLLAPASQREAGIARALAEDAAERAQQLASAQARTALVQSGLDAARHALYQRAAALLLDPALQPRSCHEACAPVERRALWSTGVSGELPVLLVELSDGEEGARAPSEGLDCVREGLRMHAFYRDMGLPADLVLLDARGGGYRHNPGGELSGLIAAGGQSDRQGAPGGVHLLDAAALDEQAVAALRRVAALRLNAGSEALSQLRAALRALDSRGGAELQPLPSIELPPPEGLRDYNGYGGFHDGEYHILLRSEREPE